MPHTYVLTIPKYTLYSYFRSLCLARLRIVLALKGVSYYILPINLLKNKQYSEAHTSLNPSALVPLLCHKTLGRYIKIEQSIAAMEYLDELHPQHPLLLPTLDAAARAKVCVLVNIISSNVQSITNLRWYSIGNEIIMADIYLILAIWNAKRYGVKLYDFPMIAWVINALKKHFTIINAHWRNQIDMPDELRYS
ncbi:hypothetical protein BGZ63DRAFT_418159 [Mariannaea sp. PMI_226]|nr:hypothetical protein BGZ63DRAFT_418159 [Mariannaea sp. PMI_226]